MIRKINFLFFIPILLSAKWNNNYSFFSTDDGSKDAANAVLNIISYLLTAFGVFLLVYSIYKLLVSNSPEDKTRGALFSNIFLAIVSVLLIANVFVIKKFLGVG